MSKAIKIEDANELKELAIASNDPDFPFVALNIKRLSNAGKNINCDVFIKISESKMTRVFSEDSGLDFLRLKQYIEKGVNEIFVRKEDFDKFTKYLQNSPETILVNSNATKDEKIHALLDLADQNVADFFSKVPLEEVSVEKTKSIIRRMLSTLTKDPALLGSLIRMAQHHDFMISHALSVSIVAMLIARGAQNANEKTLELCGVGGFLHDIGKSQIDPNIVAKYSDLTPEQWKEMRTHPIVGAKMLERCQNVTDEVRLIVLQHHEQPGGSGYPAGLRGPKIFYPAKIVAIADTLAAMLTNTCFGRSFTFDQALHEMQQESGKFDRDLLTAAAQMFRHK